MIGVIGDLVEDVVVWLHEPLRHGTDTKAEVFHVRGGSAANVARFARKYSPARFIGCVGPDRLGDSLIAELVDADVEVRVQRSGRTGSIVIVIDENGERTMFPDRGAARELGPVPSEWLSGIDLLHVTSYCFDGGETAESTVHAMVEARERGILTSIDTSSTGFLDHYGADRYFELLRRLQPDFLLANFDEAKWLGFTENAGPCRDILPRTTVVVKAGADPTVVYRPDRDALVVPVPPVRIVKDLTGAGDAFAAGFLTGYLQSRSMQRACEQGHASAAAVLATPGASTG